MSQCVKIYRSVVCTVRERICLNGRLITPCEFLAIESIVRERAEEENIEMRFFNYMTAMAFLYFALSDVEVAVVETGIGGKFDATNILRRPLVCVITSIGFDHCEMLGNTKEMIAAEKAGILKSQTHAVLGVTARPVGPFLKRARHLTQCDLILVTKIDTDETFNQENARTAR